MIHFRDVMSRCFTQVAFEPQLVPDAEGEDGLVILFLRVAQLLFENVRQVIPACLRPDMRLHASLIHGDDGDVGKASCQIDTIPVTSKLLALVRTCHLFLFFLFL